jgi:hypothetical protein
MSALTPPRLEQALALALARIEALEAALTSAHVRELEAETARDVALDERDAAIARAQRGSHAGGQELRHHVVQASVEMRSVAHTLKKVNRPAMAAAMETRAQKLVEALR